MRGAPFVFQTIETHTGGNPTRTIFSGVPRLEGPTMLAKMQDMQARYDWIRRALMFEPRGHGVMSGCVLTEPAHPEADFGVIFIEVGGYLPMCGHDTIGLVTALVETGRVPPTGPDVPVVLDTPSGLVRAVAHWDGRHVAGVSFDNVPAFVLAQDVTIEVPPFGRLTLDIAFGGNFYGLVDSAAVGIPLDFEHSRDLIRAAQRIRAAVDAAVTVVHPDMPSVRGLTHVEFYGPPTVPGADVKNMVIVPPGGVDRSPCGTGTTAKAAVLYSRGALPVGGSFVHESVTGATFTATVLEASTSPRPSVRVRIRGAAAVIGEATWFVDPAREPVGFLLP
jgi:proline racemase